MQNRAFTVSFVTAGAAVLLVHSYVESSIDEAKRLGGEEISVVVAKREIRELEMLDETTVMLRPCPGNYVEQGSTQRLEDLRGAMALVPMASGEQVLRTKVTVSGPGPGLARQVASGKRAVTIRVSDETGVAKLLKPGDRVDVVATLDPSGSGNKLLLETRVILQDRLVLATGKYVTNSVPGILEVDPYKSDTKRKVPLNEYTSYSTVTLEVNSGQLTTIVFAARNLDVYLALRNNDEAGSAEELGKTTLKDFLAPGTQLGKPQVAGPPAKK